MSLTLNDNIVLTDLAYEKAKRLGMSLVTAKAYKPPAAPVRPYISKEQKQNEIALKPADAPPSFFGSDKTAETQKTAPSLQVSSPAPTQPQQAAAESIGLTQLARRSTEVTTAPPGYPTANMQSKPDADKLRKQIADQVLLKYGNIDARLLDKIIARVLNKAGLD